MAPSVQALKAGLAHQPGDSTAAAQVTVTAKYRVDTRGSVASAGVRVDLGDLSPSRRPASASA